MQTGLFSCMLAFVEHGVCDACAAALLDAVCLLLLCHILPLDARLLVGTEVPL